MAQAVQFPHDDFGDRYAIERELGHGATATVYLARDLKFEDKFVAIKVLSPHFALAVPSERFLREIRTTAKLNHPHIVPLFDSGTTAGAPPRPFYVMRFIDGVVLRDIIARGPLAVHEALRVARQAAAALGHAHRHGVIHRDIKPGNIMMEGGHTWVTDFGIARAMAASDSQTVTSTGVSIGTPAYMSPEQAMGRGDLDARTDIYSLGCVLYEMLVGKMPFDGPDVQAVMNKHLVEPLPSICAIRPDVPERVEQLLDVALAKKRDDRFPTAAEFAEALSLQGAGALTPTRTQPVPGERRKGVRWKLRTAVAAGATFLAGVVVVVAMLRRPSLDPSRYAVIPPFEGAADVGQIDAERLLQDALNRWKGITVIGRSEIGLSGRPGKLARSAGAAWYIRGGLSRIGDSLRVRATLYGTLGDSVVRERAVNFARTLAGADAAFDRLADQLLFDDTVATANGGRAGTYSVSAREAFSEGLASVQKWDLHQADSAFRLASDLDPAYTQAHLWLAQVRFWEGSAIPTWSSSAERASAARLRLSSSDRFISDALNALSHGDLPRACATWERLAATRPGDFAGWYSLSSCLRRDRAVVRDTRSPSGWRFRSSYHHALQAFRRALRLQPSIHEGLRGNGYESLRQLFITSTLTIRAGRAIPPDTTTFDSRLAWQGDSLVFVPYRVQDMDELRPWTGRESPGIAVRHQRELFHDIATAWLTSAPKSPNALEAMAIALEMLGEPASIDTLRRARALTTTRAERLRMMGVEVWMLLKFSIPDDLAGIRTALALADSLIDVSRSVPAPNERLLASIAALTGRAHLAAALAGQSRVDPALPGSVARIGSAFVTLASLGGPADTLPALERRLLAGIEAIDEVDDRALARLQWLARGVTLAFPEQRLESIHGLRGQGDFLIDAQAAVMGGDTATALRILRNSRKADTAFAPGDLTLDGLYPEAFLLSELGHDSAAVAWLDPTLNALSTTAPLVFSDPARAGALVRAMIFRADVARRHGDIRTATRWARVVALLWIHADEFLDPVVTRMEKLQG